MDSENIIQPENNFPEDPHHKQIKNVIPEYPEKRPNSNFRNNFIFFLISGFTLVNLIIFVYTALKKFT